MAEGAGTPRGRPRGEGLDGRILDATLRLLGRGGYARMSMDGVVPEAGVSKPTIYLRWPGNAELATAALAHYRKQDLPEVTGDLRADLIAALEHFRRQVERPHGMATIGTVLAEETETPELLALFRQHVVASRRDTFRVVLQAATERGELRDDTDLDTAISMLVGSYYAYLADDALPEGWASAQVDTLLRGVGSGSKITPDHAGTVSHETDRRR